MFIRQDIIGMVIYTNACTGIGYVFWYSIIDTLSLYYFDCYCSMSDGKDIQSVRNIHRPHSVASVSP